MAIKKLFLTLALALPMLVPAQFDTGNAPPWREFKLNPKTRIKLDFKNSSPDMVVSLLSRTSGITIVKDPSLKQPLTVTSAKPVSLDEAFQIFKTVLSLAGYDLRKEENLLVIRKRPDAGAGGRGGRRGGADMMIMGGEAGQGGMEMGPGGGGNRTQLKVYEIKHANASQIARVINEVFANQQQMNQGGPQMMPGGGVVFQAPGGGGRRFGGGGGGGGGGGRQAPTVRASSDDFSNTVIVNAPSREHDQVEELIERIDKPSEQPQQPRVYKLVYASAEDVAPVIQNVLVSNAPRGRGGAGNQNVPFEQRFQQALRFGGSQAAFGTVVADARTNSLVVTATDENLRMVEQVLKELDQPIELQSSVVVIPLENARADTTAQLLNQAFGTRSGGGGNFGNFGGFGNQNRGLNNRNNRFGGNRFGGGGGGGGFGGGGGGFNPDSATRKPGEGADANAMDLELEDPNAESGPLATNVDVTQGFQIFGGGGGGFGGRFGRQTQPAARDAQGRVTNVRDLQGQVSVIADPNTNSVIVVGTPESAAIVRQVLEQLDRIPEQVMIETLIVEATLDASTKLGVEWQFTQDRAFGNNATGTGSVNFGGQTGSASGAGFRYTIAGQNFQAFINALKTDQKFEILSTPRIFTSNNVEAEINISQRVPYVVSQREDANGNLTFNYAFEDVGIVLTVTPRISANGTVTMDVVQTANDLQGFTTFNAPIVNQRQAQTTVSVQDGETIILGGIIRTSVNSTVRKVPLLGDLPILGNLFRSTDKSKTKTELLVFLTPRIVRNNAEAQRLREQTQGQLAPKTQNSVNGALERAGNGGKQ